MIGGVAGGIARRFGIDATVVRIAFVIGTLAAGWGLPLYIGACLVLPLDGQEESVGSRVQTRRGRHRPPWHRGVDPGENAAARRECRDRHHSRCRNGGGARHAPGAREMISGPLPPNPSENPTRPRVFLVDDHHLFRAGVRAELGDTVELAGEVAEVGAAIEMIIERKPDVVLLDVHLPQGGGRAVIDAVRLVEPGVRFHALSVSDAPEDVIGVIRAGARGYITKSVSGPELIDAVQRVAGGDVVFSPRLAGFVLDVFAAMPAAQREGAPPPSIDPELDQLSSREREVLRFIARGYTFRKVGSELHISAKTVESHVSVVLRKLQLSTRHQLTNWATERRLV